MLSSPVWIWMKPLCPMRIDSKWLDSFAYLTWNCLSNSSGAWKSYAAYKLVWNNLCRLWCPVTLLLSISDIIPHQMLLCQVDSPLLGWKCTCFSIEIKLSHVLSSNVNVYGTLKYILYSRIVTLMYFNFSQHASVGNKDHWAISVKTGMDSADVNQIMSVRTVRCVLQASTNILIVFVSTRDIKSFWSELWGPINEPHHEKTCLCHMRTTKAQVSLLIHAVWPAPLLFTA